MKITVIFPKFPFEELFPVVPPILEYLGALTLQHQPSWLVELFDANKYCPPPEQLETDVVAISVMTPTAVWAYAYGDRCRQLGITVVLGGIHPTALPGEAIQHADAVVLGEAESVWGQVLEDLQNNSLKPYYQGTHLELNNLPTPLDSLLKKDYRFRAFFTMRGCPYDCAFCGVPNVFGGKVRQRPIEEVAGEIQQLAGRVWFNGDDNIWAGDTTRNMALFNELAQGDKKSWFGFGDLRSVQQPKGDKLLQAARKSGLFSLMVGWESSSLESLREYHALDKQGKDRLDAIKRMQSQGIYVVLFVVMGGRQDSPDSFERTLELSHKLGVGIHPILLMPLPGTRLFEQYSSLVLPGTTWDDFSGLKALFNHPNPEMTPWRVEEEYHRLREALYRPAAILRRIARIPAAGFPDSHLFSLAKELPMGRNIRKAAATWQQSERRQLLEKACK